MHEAITRIQRIDRQPDLMTPREKAAAGRRAHLEQRFAERLSQPASGQEPELVRVRVRDIHFDERYQTPDRYDDGRARRMAAEWDWDLAVPVKLNIRPGDPDRIVWCPDGRHRVSAIGYRFGPDYSVEGILHGVPYEAEAGMFAHQDDNRKRVSVALKFNAGKEARDPAALAAQELADRLSITLGAQAGPRTVAAKAFLELCRGKGMEATEEGIRFVLERWGGSTDSMDSRFVKGIVWFVARYRDHPSYDAKKVRERLSQHEIIDIQREASRSMLVGEHKRIAEGFANLYNHQRRNLLPPWGRER